ncbi:MAG: DNA topoisomerase I [Nitrososphaerota archaeon]|jgi:DNA topoisomerase-1|nr:DNA topoisomerase I [Nitrososphaerota archaeon]MDG6903226.1 DNA topoisomerase I [Nitrososphaerota archaeon]MDG6911704.1 DNA topoisomerase I [Nitrososphaerota archaeon]MDG6940606.1 DNA topoisomerase I [Nitrososphaerota archaeon]MDG6960917.1 DNA topoisomerase I [Nitrososphaerota archaeon]
MVVDGYTLVICEKPDAARRVADALSNGKSAVSQVEGTSVFRFVKGEEEFVVCSAQGHLYGVSDPSGERTVYPVFDVEWYPLNEVDKEGATAKRRIAAIRELAAGAARFVNACDLDVEGETIGFNLLRYACGGNEKAALRARFSTLTEEDLRKSFSELESPTTDGLARAGRARHVIDFLWGVNLSRALSQSPLGSGRRYRTVSVGRVQGPTLGFLAKREREIREFVPTPCWKVTGSFQKDGKEFSAGYAEEKVKTKAKAEEIRMACRGGTALVTMVRRSTARVSPPTPFSLGDLQREAYRVLRVPPSRTLRIAESLYLAALISYPRTNSQMLPISLDLRRILGGIGKMPAYSRAAEKITKSGARTVQGTKSDPAHPAIHPTGGRPLRHLDAQTASLFDLIVRRFLAGFGPPAVRELVEVSLEAEGHRFRTVGSRTAFPGWMEYYGSYAGRRDIEPPPVSEGDRVEIVKVTVAEKFEQRPPRYNQGSLLEKMENEGIGTKATRADIISTLLSRGYASGENLEVTDLGFAVVEAMEKYAPSVVSTDLTRQVEERLEGVEDGTERESGIVRETIRTVSEQLAKLLANEEEVGKEIDGTLVAEAARLGELGKCPVCKSGRLRVVRSRTTKKRFAGCSNYSSGCSASAPLPQRGTIRPVAKPCVKCSWPVVYISWGRRPWKLCVNPSCPGRRKS